MTRKLNLLFILMLILTLALTACGGGNDDDDKPADEPSKASGDATKGKALYVSACSACHGSSGEGVTGLGKSWTGSTFIQGLDDDEMLAFIKKGRPIGDPANTTGVDMPPKGGNPALNDEDLLNIIAFMRTLQ
jgi:disulfide bond formation protein DsbB